MNSLTFFHNINSNINSTILSVLNLVLFSELTVACCLGIYQNWTIGKAIIGKITEPALYTTILLVMDTTRNINLYEQAFSSKELLLC
jgi:hypothetical protein